MKKGRKKESEKEREAAGMDVDDGQPLEEPSFPLVDVPDAEVCLCHKNILVLPLC